MNKNNSERVSYTISIALYFQSFSTEEKQKECGSRCLHAVLEQGYMQH